MLVKKCASCDLEIARRESDTWFFMYMTTAALTGVFILTMLLYKPANELLGRVGIATGGLALILLTVRRRKGMAIALEYLLDSRLKR